MPQRAPVPETVQLEEPELDGNREKWKRETVSAFFDFGLKPYMILAMIITGKRKCKGEFYDGKTV